MNNNCPSCGAPGISGTSCEYCGSFIPFPPGEQPVAIQKHNKCDVILVSSGSAKLRVIKAFVEECKLGLKQAKDRADHIPCIIAENVPFTEADRLKAVFERAGAVVKIQDLV